MANLTDPPRHTCALGGAIATASALPGTIPVLHAPPGCASNTTWTQAGGCGLQLGGYCGGLSMPGTNMQEREVVFGGSERLQELIKNAQTVMEGDLYFVLTSCVAEVIGDDIGAIVKPFQDEGIPVIYAETGGFKGNSYTGYDLTLQSLWENFIPPAAERVPEKVNLWGIPPFFDAFWRGNLEGLRQLLCKLGLTVNTFFTAEDTLEGIREAGSASLNILVSDGYGTGAAELSRQKHGIPYVVSPLPIGPAASDEFLRSVGAALGLDRQRVETVIGEENRRYYRYLDTFVDCYNDMDLQRYAAVAGDANYAPAVTRFLADDLGWLPEVVAVSDVLTEEQERAIRQRLEKLSSGLRPKVYFTPDTSEIRRCVKEHWTTEAGAKYANKLTPAFVVGSSLERELAKDLQAGHLSVSFPVSNRAILDRGYTGYRGGLRFIEDLIGVIAVNR
ncbi:MAG TPA: hypothetical protein DEA44_02920 [Firmicutes bacterium]|nr:hypothetical protein [Bacillota bacterium]